MTELRLRSRTVSEVVDTAFALYRRHATQYILVTALASAPSLILQLVLPSATPQTMNDIGWPVLIVSVASFITYSLMSAVVVKLGSQVYLGVEPDLAQTVREVLPRVPSVMVAALLKALVILLAALLCLVPWAVLVGLLKAPFLFVLGAPFFVVAVLYVTGRYFAVSTVVVLEGRSAAAAVGRSAALSSGRE